ncbi:nucleotidyl transferase AbiEii/AbiGii toxin family protein [Fibrella sp. HMF5335]|uniref:Nucleotidyl transferase AbiEii/AbiGii toxin family protein n=1 Tax=Fibrella rubiginis TaxID=2817060 RepID=A0A939GK15_9BACT|nr:nucleotidyl transferase AbiEii/AbiGii toxin family protein [Fibrella rubiginis]MBO0938196.1 nucleotidyl transferase AbiEii/AbiGii toxin family protein [Fibrella rubiginis]
MLHTETVAEPTLDLLNCLLATPELANFSLVGGTNLSLRLGHRISVDLDLFTPQPFNLTDVQNAIRRQFPSALELTARKQTLLFVIDDVKVDILLHEYPYLQPIDVVENIRLVSLPDVIAMKLGAVAGRGAKKDFCVIDRLLQQYRLADMMGFYTQKYPQSDPGQVVRSLVYFDDAEEQENPNDLQQTTWPIVKQGITTAVQQYIQALTR